MTVEKKTPRTVKRSSTKRTKPRGQSPAPDSPNILDTPSAVYPSTVAPSALSRLSDLAQASETLAVRLNAIRETDAFPELKGKPALTRNKLLKLSLGLAKGNSEAELTPESVDIFLVGLSVGFPIDIASALAGHTPSAFYRRRQRDQDFRQQWVDAVEQSTEPILQRLEEVALSDAPSMVTVRAAEAVLKARHPALRPAKDTQPRTIMIERDPASGVERSVTIVGGVAPLAQ